MVLVSSCCSSDVCWFGLVSDAGFGDAGVDVVLDAMFDFAGYMIGLVTLA